MTSREILRRAPDAVWRRVDDQITIISLEANRVRLLNGVGGFLWERCEGATPAELVSALCGQYAVERPTAERDVTAFVSDLERRGLLRRDAVEGRAL